MIKDLPVGMSRNTGRNKGYRLNRTVRGKEYNFGTFQNYEHALRTNGYIDIITADLKESQEKEGVLSVNEIREMLAENSVADLAEITSLVEKDLARLDRSLAIRFEMFTNVVVGLQERLEIKQKKEKSFWQRISGR